MQGADGQCRVAKVKVGDTELTRSLGHLYPLEFDVEIELAAEDAKVVPETPQVETPEVEEMETDSVEVVAPPGDESVMEVEQPNPEPHQSEAEEPGEETRGEVNTEGRVRRGAAIRAAEKIAEWTHLLMALPPSWRLPPPLGVSRNANSNQ